MQTRESKEKMVLSGVYAIVNLLNNKCYIGRTNHFQNRLQDHKSALKSGRHANDHLQAAYVKDGKENFEFVILLETTSLELAMEYEIKLMALFGSIRRDLGYNKTFSSLGISPESLKDLYKDNIWYQFWYRRCFLEEGLQYKGAEGLKNKLKSDPEYAKLHAKTAGENSLKSWSDPVIRERIIEAQRKAASNPENKKKKSTSALKMWKKDGFVERRKKSAKNSWLDKNSVGNKKRLQGLSWESLTPEQRERRLAGIKNRKRYKIITE